MLLYQILAYAVLRKIEKILRKTINLTYQLQRGRKKLNYLMDHICIRHLKLF